MSKIDRHTFLKQSLSISALAMVNPFGSDLFARAEYFTSEDDFYQLLVDANDNYVSILLKSISDEVSGNNRGVGHNFAALSASYCAPTSQYYQKPILAEFMGKLCQFLLEYQHADGTMDFGNLQSPPDTGFLLEPLCAGTSVLMGNKSKALDDIKRDLKIFILKAGDGLTEGGVHTPNHRWVISSALAQINALYPNPKYVARINDWLDEGVFIDADGHYLERSRNYSSVINRSFITMGRLLNNPSLFDPVRKNLEMTYYYMEPNGDLVTTDSRRQDQFSSKSIISYYLSYRYLAIQDSNKEFAAIAKLIEGLKGFEESIMKHSLVDFMDVPLLRKNPPVPDPPPVNYEKFFVTTSLARIRKRETSATIFGGVDWPLIIGSGRSTSPNFFSFRKGEAILKYLRLSAGFFSTGYFRSEGLKKEGNKYILYKKLEVPYYQPLPEEKRREDGDYKLSHSIDGRFWNKMDFENRPVSNVKTLEYTVSVEEIDGKVELSFIVSGSEKVPVTIELCFKEGGKLTGVTPAPGQPDNQLLEKGMGEYQFEKDTIAFGPGTVAHKRIRDLDGEMYTSHFGTLRTEGMHVYLTGKTPFEHKLTIQ